MDKDQKDKVKRKLNKAMVSHMREEPIQVCAICDGETDEILELPFYRYEKDGYPDSTFGGEGTFVETLYIKMCDSHKPLIGEVYKD